MTITTTRLTFSTTDALRAFGSMAEGMEECRRDDDEHDANLFGTLAELVWQHTDEPAPIVLDLPRGLDRIARDVRENCLDLGTDDETRFTEDDCGIVPAMPQTTAYSLLLHRDRDFSDAVCGGILEALHGNLDGRDDAEKKITSAFIDDLMTYARGSIEEK
jgi:hypothetical protein